jgi:hypothetical protein
MKEAEKVVEIFSFCGCRPKRLYEITVASFHVPFRSSVTTHGTERTTLSPSVLIIMEHTAAVLHEAVSRNLLQ